MNQVSKGKVRNMYQPENQQELVIVTSDRISAFDVVLPSVIPNKGIILNEISEFWFEYLKDVIPNHLISTNVYDMDEEFQNTKFLGRTMLVKKLEMLPIECIVRGYITGSGLESYKKTGMVCGISLPEGLIESEKLETPIYTPTTKVAEGHDEHISFDETVELIGEELATKLREKSIEIYSKCADYALTKGIIIADTKFEFGVDENGELVLADEVLTPDSSRFWDASLYEVGKSQKSFDKQYIRDWLSKEYKWDKKFPAPELPEEVIKVTVEKYCAVVKMITG